jgi:glutamine transport system substrate-binding protein
MKINYRKNRSSLLIIISIFILLVFLSASFSGCKPQPGSGENGNTEADASTSQKKAITDEPEVTGTAMEKSILIAASDTTFPPFEFLEDGEVVGFDIDIINEIATRLEKEIAIEKFHWDPEFKGLQEGEYDLVISAVPYDEEKETDVDFSEPYFSMKYVLISLLGSDITMKEELVGKNIGTINSGTGAVDEEYLSSFEIIEYEDAIALLEALKDKEIEAILVSLPIAANLLKENEDIYSVIEEVPADKDFVIVFAKDNGLKPEFDAALKAMKDDGTYGAIFSKWFDYSSAISIQE